MRYIVLCSFCLLVLGCSSQHTQPSSPSATPTFGVSADPDAKPVDKQWQYQDSVERAAHTTSEASTAQDLNTAATTYLPPPHLPIKSPASDVAAAEPKVAFVAGEKDL